MNRTGAITLGAMLVAGSAFASNTGFKLNYTLEKPAGRSGNNWVSLPYFYFPDGNVANTNVQNSLDLCRDINDFQSGTPKVLNVIRFRTPTDTPQTQSCASPIKVFDLKVGEGYSFVPTVDQAVVNIVGSHDDTYAKNKVPTPTLYSLEKPTGRSGNNWFSVPYHAKANNSLDLCADLNNQMAGTPLVLNLIRFRTATDTPQTQSCASPIKVFDLKPGEGYSLVPTVNMAGVSVEVY